MNLPNAMQAVQGCLCLWPNGDVFGHWADVYFNNLSCTEKGERLSNPGWEKHSVFLHLMENRRAPCKPSVQDGCVIDFIAY